MTELTDERLEALFSQQFPRTAFSGAYRRFGYAVAAEVDSPELVAAALSARAALRMLVSALGAARLIMRDAEVRAMATELCDAGQAALDALDVTLPAALDALRREVPE